MCYEPRAKFLRHFKGPLWVRHLRVRILSTQQLVRSLWAISGLQEYVRRSRELARLYAVSEATCSGFSDATRPIACSGLWSRIFNIRVVTSETRFEVARDGFDTRWMCETE